MGSCKNDVGCFWHPNYIGSPNGSCFNKLTFDCGPYYTQGACQEYKACFWNKVAGSCRNANSPNCMDPAFNTQPTCDTMKPGCFIRPLFVKICNRWRLPCLSRKSSACAGSEIQSRLYFMMPLATTVCLIQIHRSLVASITVIKLPA
jgi:hypothetical protein